MIVFYAQGGLGNQLFQYATARRLAIKNNCPLVVDHSWFVKPPNGETIRSFDLERYPVVMRLATPQELELWAVLRSRWSPYLNPFLPLRLIKERGDEANLKILNATRNSYLHGYWQSEKYFSEIRKELLSEFTPIDSPGHLDSILIERMQCTESVSLHIRRGDYVTLASASAYHGLCSIDYYHDAVRRIADQFSDLELFIFSDDPEWVKDNLRFSYPTHYVDHNPAHMAFQDLRLMTMCRHHILANSSFSWWGAWLSSSSDGLVIAPENWFAADRKTPDLVPPRWIKLVNRSL